MREIHSYLNMHTIELMRIPIEVYKLHRIGIAICIMYYQYMYTICICIANKVFITTYIMVVNKQINKQHTHIHNKISKNKEFLNRTLHFGTLFL